MGMKRLTIIILLGVFTFGPMSTDLLAASGSKKDTGASTSDQQSSDNGQKNSQGSSISAGTVTAGDKTGIIESTVLSAAAAHEAAKQISISVQNSTSGAKVPISKVVILDDTVKAQLDALSNYNAGNELLQTLYKNAEAIKNDAENEMNNIIPPPTSKLLQLGVISSAVGEVTQAIGQIVSLFKTDISTNGVEINLDNEVLVAEVTAELSKDQVGKKPLKVVRPTLYSPYLLVQRADLKVINSLADNFTNRVTAQKNIEKLTEDTTNLDKLKNDPNNKVPIGKITDAERHLQQALNANQAFINIFDSFIGSYKNQGNGGGDSTDPNAVKQQKLPDSGDPSADNTEKQSSPASKPNPSDANDNQQNSASGTNSTTSQKQPTFADILKAQWIVDTYLADKGTVLLTLQIQKSGGGYMTKSNLWTYFGAPALFHSGGIVVTFTLINPEEGNVLASGTIPVYQYFIKASRINNAVDDLRKNNRN